LIVTAAHCIYEHQDITHSGGYQSNLLFIPKLLGTGEPYGRWPGTRGWIYDGYCGGDCTPGEEVPVQGEDRFWGLDYGVITMNTKDAQGRYVGDRTSWYTIQANPQGTQVYAQGYPAEGWYEDNCGNLDPDLGPSCYVYYCYTTVGQFFPITGANGWYEVGFGCPINGGASGGPIFEYLNGKWRVASVISHIANIVYYPAYPDRWFAGNTWGPFFNNYVISLWQAHVIT
jgi:hypothetical protein